MAGVILAGGRGARMGGADKGWVRWHGRPLVEQVRERFAPQVDCLLISANRNLERYRALGVVVVSDDARRHGAYVGPLAGMLAALRAAPAPWVAFAPCDAPALPRDLVRRLWQASAGRAPAVARCAGRVQPVFCLLPRAAAETIEALLDAGERRPAELLRRLGANPADFERVEEFANVNALEAQDVADAS